MQKNVLDVPWVGHLYCIMSALVCSPCLRYGKEQWAVCVICSWLIVNVLTISFSAKYPLAIISKLLSVYGQNGGCVYDIGCAFSSTLRNSCLGAQAEDLRLCMMVGTFHGHAHNRMCQLDWHPQYIQGTGHTEGEGCEHVFATSNELARSTRHATSFHHHQAIEQHFTFWDADKYAALSEY